LSSRTGSDTDLEITLQLWPILSQTIPLVVLTLIKVAEISMTYRKPGNFQQFSDVSFHDAEKRRLVFL
jgi:hypothetical protein